MFMPSGAENPGEPDPRFEDYFNIPGTYEYFQRSQPNQSGGMVYHNDLSSMPYYSCQEGDWNQFTGQGTQTRMPQETGPGIEYAQVQQGSHGTLNEPLSRFFDDLWRLTQLFPTMDYPSLYSLLVSFNGNLGNAIDHILSTRRIDPNWHGIIPGTANGFLP